MKLFVASCRANAEIAQVRAKAKQEQAAYQASLRKEQMKVDSLERTLDQKVCLHCHTCLLSVFNKTNTQCYISIHWTNPLQNKLKYKAIIWHNIFDFFSQNKEIEELTKICDELIAKMGKS